MKSSVKRIVVTILTVCLIFGSVPVEILAAEPQMAAVYNGGVLDIGSGPITIGDGVITHGEIEYSYVGTPQVTVTGTTTKNQIKVESGVTASVTLSDVSVDLSTAEIGAALEIADDSTGDVTVTLVGSNLLKGSEGSAALQKNGADEGVGTLTISGEGFMEAVGGMACAGIGGAYGENVANITITGGAITVTGGGVAGIGKGEAAAGVPEKLVVLGGSIKNGTSGTGVFEKDAFGDVIARDAKGGYIRPMTINNETGEDLIIDEVSYPKVHGTSTELCVYLSVDGIHHVKVGASENDYVFEGAIKQEFVCLAQTPETVTAHYGDTLADVNLPMVTGGSWNWEDTETSVGIVGERDFVAYFTPDASGMYYAEPTDVTVKVLPKEIAVKDASIYVKDYDKTPNATVTSVTFDGLVGEDTLALNTDFTVTAQFEDADAGTEKIVTGQIELLNTEVTKNYTLKERTFVTTGTIGRIVYYDVTAEDVQLTYGDSDGKVTAESEGDGQITYSVIEGSDVVSVDENTGRITIRKAGTATVKVSVAATVNYAERSKNITVTVDKKKITPPQVNEHNEFVYTGLPQTYQLVESDDYTISNATKTAAGEGYEAVLTLKDPANTEWASELPAYVYTIKKASVTITANDKTMIDDEDYPVYDYAVSGLVNNEKLTIEPTISCASDKTVGEHTIVVTGPEESDNYRYTYVNGTLTITVRETPTITADDLVFSYGDGDGKVDAQTSSDGVLAYEVTQGDDVISIDGVSGVITIHKAGLAKVKISVPKTDKCYAVEKTINVTVTKKKITPPAQSEKDIFTYNGQPHAYVLPESEYYIIEGEMQTNAGSYEASVVLSDPENTEWASELPAYAYAIWPAKVTITANDKEMGDDQDFPVYDFTVSGLVNGEELPIAPMVLCDASRKEGTYVIKVTGPESYGNYTYTYVDGILTVAIRVEPEVSAEDIIMTYGDVDQVVEVETDSKGVCSYEMIEGDDVISVDEKTGEITALKAGTATVKVTVKETANHFAGSTTLSVTVNKKQVVITANDKSMVDDEEFPVYDSTIEGLVNGEELPISLDYSCASDKTVGTYDIVVTGPEESDNYEYTYVTGTLTVAAREKAVITAKDVVISYGDTEVAVIATTNSDGAMSYEVTEGRDVISVDSKTGGITIHKAGSAEVKISTPKTDKCYAANVTIAVTVNKKKIEVPKVNEQNEFTYTGLPQTYVLEESEDYTISNATKTMAGEGYEATVVLKDPENTEWASELPLYVYTIKKVSVTITANDKTMMDDEDYPVYDYEISGLVNGEELPISPSISCASDKTVGEHPIIVTGPEESENYQYKYINGTLTVTVREVPTITADNLVFSYGDTAVAVNATANSDGVMTYEVTEGNDVISVDSKTGVITIHKAGSAEVKISVSKTDKCYAANKTVTVMVNKKKVAVPQVSKQNEFIYTGLPQTYVLEGSEDYTISNATKTMAGEGYEAVLTLKDPENTEWASELPVYIYSIKKAQVVITANDQTIRGDEEVPLYDYEISGLVNGEELPIRPTISCASEKTAGDYPIIVAGPAESDNYKYTYVNGTLTVVTRETAVITAKDVAISYGDTNMAVNATTNSDGVMTYEVKEGRDVISVDSKTGAIVILGLGEATVEITVAETENYLGATKQIGVTVKKAINAPNMPSNTFSVACKTSGVNAVYLPTDWEWSIEDADKSLIEGDKVSATAVYVGKDGSYYENCSLEIEIIRAAHVEGEEVFFDGQNDVLPSCENAGSGHTECSVCGETVRTEISGKAIGHAYETSFDWTTDGKRCVLKMVCKNDASHVVSNVCVVTSTVKMPATCNRDGVTTYTATYGNYVTTKDMTDIPKTEHAWDEGVVTANPTQSAEGVMTYTCKVCRLTKTERIASLPKPMVGKTISSGDAKYVVTKVGEGVEYKAPLNKKVKKVVIPATITVEGVTYKVTGIAKKAFANNKKITSVVIGKNVKVIGDEAFSKCATLQSITIPAGVKQIGKKAFYNCKALKKITIKTTKLTAKNVGVKAWKGAGSKSYSKVKVKVPKKKLVAYKKLFKQKGMSPKIKVK